MARPKQNTAVDQSVNEADFNQVAKQKATSLQSIDRQEISDGENSDSLIAVPAESIPVNTALPCTVYMKAHGKTLVFRRQGERVNYKTALEFQKKGTNTLYIHRAFWQMFMDSLEHMKIPKGDGDDKVATAMHMRHLLLAYGTELDKQIKEPKKPLFDKLRQLALGFVAILEKDPGMAPKLLRRSSDPLDYFVNHSVNTAIYSFLMGQKLHMREEELRNLTYAAIVHDVGNLFLPKRILYKRYDLTPDEVELVHTHPRRGAEFLQSLGTVGPVVKAVMQHHERMDGEGYPDKVHGREICMMARIIAIADTYDALTSDRPNSKAIPAADALKKMTEEMRGAFDTALLSNLG